jgi:hypothetical protein
MRLGRLIKNQPFVTTRTAVLIGEPLEYFEARLFWSNKVLSIFLNLRERERVSNRRIEKLM